MRGAIPGLGTPYPIGTLMPAIYQEDPTVALDRVGRDVPERARHRNRVAKLRRELTAIGIPFLQNQSHIIPVMVGDPVKCKMISDWLLDKHSIYIQPINYPTVPRGTERLRITPSPLHSDGDIARLTQALSELWSMCALSRKAVAA